MSNSELLKLKQLWDSYEQEWNEILVKEHELYDSVSAGMRILASGEISMETYDECEMLFRNSAKLLKETSVRKIQMFTIVFGKIRYDAEEIEDQPEVNKEWINITFFILFFYCKKTVH